MNTKRLVISIIVVFVAITVTDILIHGVCCPRDMVKRRSCGDQSMR